MTPSTPPPPTIRRATWVHGLVLPRLLATATVGLIVATEKQAKEITIDVMFTNLADDLLVMDPPRPVIRLMVAGSSATLDHVDPQSASYRMNLAGLGAGTHTLPVQLTDIRLPGGLSPRDLLTPSLTIRLEPMVTKTAGVVAVLEGNPAPGYAVASVNLTPDRIVLKGTDAMLSAIETVNTRPLNLEAAAESFKKQVPLNLPEAIGVEPPLRIVLAEVIIKERIITRVMENIPISGRGTTDTYRIDPQTITLTVSGPESVVNSVETDPAFAVTVDMAGLSPGTHNLKAIINLPVAIKLVRISSERFSVTIEK